MMFIDNSQIEWIANEIENNLKNDELNYKDIIVIHTNPIKTQSATGSLRKLLFTKGINSHLVGDDTSPDGFFEENSITFTSIYRAKGNEAPMVYVMDGQYCYGGADLIKKRNILFTALTRSKGWVRLSGFGDDMNKLAEECKAVIDKGFKLDFKYPTEEEMKKLNIIHRDKTKDEKQEIKNQQKNLEDLLQALKDGKLYPEDFTPEILNALRKELLK